MKVHLFIVSQLALNLNLFYEEEKKHLEKQEDKNVNSNFKYQIAIDWIGFCGFEVKDKI